MAVFSYIAVEGSGTVAADSLRGARDTLRRRGLTVSRVDEVTAGEGRTRAGRWGAGRWGAGGRFDLKEVARELATLLGVGVPVVEAIEALSRSRRGKARAILDTLSERLRNGVSLADAMREPAVATHFDELSVQLVEVGEQAGTLEEVLDRLAEFRERRDELRSRLGTAMLYPGFVTVVAAGTSVFLMTAVVPKVLEPLRAQGRDLPAITKVVQSASEALVDYGLVLGLGAALLCLAGFWALRDERGKEWWHRMQLKLPLVGPVLRKQAMTQMAVAISTLQRSGIDFSRACALTARSTPQRVIRRALQDARDAVVNGSDVASALEATGQFPPVVVQAFAVGQQSGQLEKTLDRVAKTYEADVQRSTQRLTSMLEPVLIVLIAFLVGAIALATMLPILEASDVF
ncbi:MAG: type II secretion system F family protein [Planctomycetota bacterium]